MHLLVVRCLALMLVLKATASPLPQVADGSDDGEAPDPLADAIAAYEEAAPAADFTAAAPVGGGSEILPADRAGGQADAAADANSGGLQKRAAQDQPCAAQPTSLYSSSSNDLSPLAWQQSSEFSSAALNAVRPTSSKIYNLIPGWRNLNASAEAPQYRGYTSDLTSYNTSACAERCNKITGCMSFDIYFERDPTQKPDRDAGCPNPAAMTLIKCAFYGLQLDPSMATNDFQSREDFVVHVAGSNAYTSNVVAPPGYSGPVSFGKNTIEAPDRSYQGVQVFADQGYDPTVCAAACDAKTAYASRHPAQARPCNFFDAYLVYKDGDNPLFTCTYYTTPWDVPYATNPGQKRNGHTYTNDFSNGFTSLSYSNDRK